MRVSKESQWNFTYMYVDIMYAFIQRESIQLYIHVDIIYA